MENQLPQDIFIDPAIRKPKDFLVEIARSVDILDNCGINKLKVYIEMTLSPEEFDKTVNHLNKKVIIYGEKPKKEFKINLSGVEVKFVKSN